MKKILVITLLSLTAGSALQAATAWETAMKPDGHELPRWRFMAAYLLNQAIYFQAKKLGQIGSGSPAFLAMTAANATVKGLDPYYKKGFTALEELRLAPVDDPTTALKLIKEKYTEVYNAVNGKFPTEGVASVANRLQLEPSQIPQ